MTPRLILVSAGALLAAAATSCGGSETTGSGGSTSASSDASTASSTSSSSGGAGGSSSSSSSSGAGGSGGTAPVEPSCATTGKSFLLCDDFESGAVGDAPDAATWQVDKGAGATIDIDDAQFKHGKHALHLHTLAAASKALLHETKTFPLPDGKNSIYGRANFLLGEGINVPLKHTNLFEASGKVNGVNGKMLRRPARQLAEPVLGSR